MKFDLELTYSIFEDKVDNTFTVNLGESTLDLQLVEATQIKPVPTGPGVPEGLRDNPFTLLFRGPETEFLPQRLYDFNHETLGEFTMFITATGKDEKGIYYEAVVN